MAFSGFSRDTAYTSVPNQLFGPLLEEIEDMAELKVTLRGIWLCHRQRGMPRMTPLAEFTRDRALLRGLGGSGVDAAQEVKRGLALAVARGTFLRYKPETPGEGQEFYLLNTDHDRRALEKLQGRRIPEVESSLQAGDDLNPDLAPKPNIFTLYEENIGMLSPMLAEELKDAEETYPEEWLREAFAISVRENRRSWRYISGILRRWAAEGRDHGKPGRHPQEDSRQRYLEEYQRRRGRLPWERTGNGSGGQPRH